MVSASLSKAVRRVLQRKRMKTRPLADIFPFQLEEPVILYVVLKVQFFQTVLSGVTLALKTHLKT